MKLNRTGRVASIEKVADEIKVVDDDLATWVREHGDRIFLRQDLVMAAELQTVSDWAFDAGYDPAAIATFTQVADIWLVAHALAHNCTVVTHEIPANSTRKIKIPNACIGLGIQCVNPFEMLREERARFVLGRD